MLQNLSDKFEKINFTSMDDVALTKWLRSNPELRNVPLVECLRISKLIRKAYQLGEIRAKAINR